MIRVAQPPESKLDRIQREIRQEQDSDRTLDRDFVAPAACYMPIEQVSVRMREHLLELCLGQNGEKYGRHSEVE